MRKNPPKWQVATTFPELGQGDVHVWLVDLKAAMKKLHYFEQCLNSVEMERAKKFTALVLYQHFVIARGMLREVLGAYSQSDPHKIVFKYNENGKPAIHSTLFFNISHSKNYLLLAFSQGIEIGIDIEHCREIVQVEEISARFFSQQEFDEIKVLSSSKKIQKFYDIWVKKESYTKAQGGRIFDTLREFRQKNLHIDRDTAYYIESLFFDEAYAAAFATDRKPEQLKCFQLGLDEILPT